MAHAHVRITIQQPLEQVFAYISNYGNNHLWQEGVLTSRQVTPGPPAIGAELAYERKLAGRKIEANAKITELIDNRRIRLLSDSRMLHYSGGYDFEAAPGGGTVVNYAGDIKLRGVLRFASGVVAKRFQSQMEGDLARLKTLLERG